MPFIEDLQFDQDNPLAYQAAQLIVSKVFNEPPKVVRAASLRYIKTNANPDWSHLGLFDDDRQLLGAASVFHAVAPQETEISTIAIDPTFQRRGNGKTFLHFIAERTIAKGDEVISLDCYDSLVKGFYTKVGFKLRGEADSSTLWSSAKSLFARTT